MATMTLERSHSLPTEIQKPAIWDGLFGIFANLKAASQRRAAMNEIHALRRSGHLDIEADQVETMVDEMMAKKEL